LENASDIVEIPGSTIEGEDAVSLKNIPLIGRIAGVHSSLVGHVGKGQLGSGDGKVTRASTRLRSRDRLKKLSWFHPQCVRQFDDVDQPDVAFASLDSTDIVSM
jgi:hypothetical protein